MRILRTFSKKHPSMKEYRESLKDKDYEDLVNDGMDNFYRTVDHGAISALDSVAAPVLINSAVKHAQKGKKKTAAVLGTLGAVEGLAAGVHAKAAVSHGMASRAAKLEIRRRKKEKKDKRN